MVRTLSSHVDNWGSIPQPGHFFFKLVTKRSNLSYKGKFSVHAALANTTNLRVQHFRGKPDCSTDSPYCNGIFLHRCESFRPCPPYHSHCLIIVLRILQNLLKLSKQLRDVESPKAGGIRLSFTRLDLRARLRPLW